MKKAKLTEKQISIWTIVVSIFFAALILLNAALFDYDNVETVNFILIAIWFVPYSYLSGKVEKC